MLLTKVEDRRCENSNQKPLSTFAETMIIGTQVQGQIVS
jgi:hypothetical protein